MLLISQLKKMKKGKAARPKPKEIILKKKYVVHPWDSLPQEAVNVSIFRRCSVCIPQCFVDREELGCVM